MTLDRADHVQHRMSAAGPAIEDAAGAAAAQIDQRRRMGAGEVADMEIVADRRSVLCRRRGIEDVESAGRSEGDGDRALEQARFMRLPGPMAGTEIHAGDIDGAQNDVAEPAGRCEILQDHLAHQHRSGIGRER
ncbi:hypothetical protein ACS54_00135 [Bacillus cereus]|nr:hypothetical protein ACS54_00135 [Bacillus cereus]